MAVGVSIMEEQMTPNEEGRAYFLKYGSKYSNPYPRGTNAHNEFERGWSQALKARPEFLKKENNMYNPLPKKHQSTADDYIYAKKK